MAKRRKIDRYGLCPAKQNAPQKECHQGKNNRAKRIDMTDRIQADAALRVRSEIAKMLGHITMRGLMQCNCKNHRERIDGNILENAIHLQVQKAQDSLCLAAPLRACLRLTLSLCPFAGRRLPRAPPAQPDARAGSVSPLHR